MSIPSFIFITIHQQQSKFWQKQSMSSAVGESTPYKYSTPAIKEGNGGKWKISKTFISLANSWIFHWFWAIELNFLQKTYSSCAMAPCTKWHRGSQINWWGWKSSRLLVLASQKLTAWSEEGARGREMGELPGSMGGGVVGIGDRQKVKVYGLRRWQQHQQGLIRRETIRLAAGAAENHISMWENIFQHSRLYDEQQEQLLTTRQPFFQLSN